MRTDEEDARRGKIFLSSIGIVIVIGLAIKTGQYMKEDLYAQALTKERRAETCRLLNTDDRVPVELRQRSIELCMWVARQGGIE